MYEWKNEYAIGVERLDKAHKNMFAVMQRVRTMIAQGGNLKWAVMESLKFFRIYAINHFADEEEFMREVGYANYRRHKAVHDGMRDKILPRIYSQLEHSQYDEASINRYLSVCGQWLDRHILGHDRDLVKWVED